METSHNFTPRAQQAIEVARQAAKENNTRIIELCHLSYGILHLKADHIMVALQQSNIDLIELQNFILNIIDENKDFVDEATSGEGAPAFSSGCARVFDVAIALSEKLGHGYIGLEHLFLALSQLKDSPINSYAISTGVDPQLLAASMKRHFVNDKLEPIGPQYFPEEVEEPVEKEGPAPYLAKFSVNFNDLVKEGKLDAVVGREAEINDVCEILCRKKKNNPILLGDPGVGKTAIAEGLAQKIVAGDAPEHLLSKIIYGLDLGLLVAGTKYRGQFEERLKKIIKEVSSNDRVVLFIDEIHTLIGAGSAEGTMDAANMLKPALARGEIVCIGATTFEEHKKTIAKDGALDRRFQAVKVDEPSKEDTVKILKAIAPYYEKFHGVEYTQKALDLCVHLSDKYIGDKFFPDKAIDLLDHSGSKAKIIFYKRPDEAKQIEKELEGLMMEEDEDPTNEGLKDKQELLFQEYQTLLVRWADTREKKQAIVTASHVFESVSQKAKIPLDSLYNASKEKFLSLNKRLKKEIVGQDEAIEKIYTCLLRGHTILKQKKRPFGAFLCLGSSGVGKSYLAKVLAKEVFGGEHKLIQLDMSEYSEKISATRMVGASPGYVGYEEGGQLTEKVRKNPYSVLLFDEIEKADPSVCQMLLQILEEGRLTDNFGRETRFDNCIIILTGNIGAKAIKDNKNMGFLNPETDKKAEVITEAKGFFKPEFLNRLDDTIVFNTFTSDDLKKILALELRSLEERVAPANVVLNITSKAKETLVQQALEQNDGARPLKRLIEENIETPLAPFLLKGETKFNICSKKSEIIVSPQNEI